MNHWHLKASSEYFVSTRYLTDMARVDWRGSSSDLRFVAGSFLKSARSAHWPFVPLTIDGNSVRFVHAFRPSWDFTTSERRSIEALLENLDSDFPEFIWFSRSFVLHTPNGSPEPDCGRYYTIPMLLDR